ncbi:hypothetical protein [Hoyosella subflava]|uniref:Uncharacterized protein n=1 Tax=Hoyosella subflava (strain DSM 45089 / JCM 17490 / NBRC 109087 / DQS3-9A1) TaxID=443218 RepID=F6ERE9_HOYSD|nr:hypothetical protein [Hoyosella subflava]AEF38469.1 hypothetical protein AS9A_0009 [Hoyosella subflava DQS3-9A1]
MRIIKILTAAGIGIAVGLGVIKIIKSRESEYAAETWHTLPFEGTAGS